VAAGSRSTPAAVSSADSEPEAEYEETITKARAFLEALT
jgi:anthranilate/para-aminobenzoate synthase component I